MFRSLRIIYILSKREFFCTLFSTIAFIFAGIFLAFFADQYYYYVTQEYRVRLVYVFNMVNFIMIFMIPMITMRSFAEEKKSGTLETQLTAPVLDVELVAAKFIGNMGFFIFLLAPTLIYTFVLMSFGGKPNVPEMAMGYAGVILIAAVYTSFGLLCSALVRDQIVSAFVASIALFLLNNIGKLTNIMEASWADVVRNVSVLAHYSMLIQGIFDTRGVVYLSTLIFVFLFFTVKVVEVKKWQ